jgi:hypothetical protein
MPTSTPTNDRAVIMHQHMWTTTSPMRCIECRRYLVPRWRRLAWRLSYLVTCLRARC